MPFIGRDWRSPGEAWVKTESLGWQRMKIIESQLYPACHQTHSACSWPPRNQFGQHMASNSKRENENCEIGAANMIQNHHRAGGCGSGGSSSPCSSTSSCSGSASTSPTGSPEKNNAHHLHPITISSPYGRFSYCAHHHVDSPCGSPKTTYFYHDTTTLSSSNNARQQFETQLQMSRSLSRESVEVPDSCNGDQDRLRYNRSVSDFRSSQEGAAPIGDNEATGYGNHEKLRTNRELSFLENRNAKLPLTTPTLMKNGNRITCDELPGTHDNDQEPKQASSSKTNSSPADQRMNDKCGNQLTPATCNSCCCCSSQHCSQAIHLQREPHPRAAPHCRISVRTREVAMYNTISEAFYRLDFCNAIHDIRRFNYICKLLHLLITQNLTSLSGCATKVLFTMLEQVAWEVSSNKRNIHVLKNLLNELKLMIQKYYCWGRPIGSSALWQQHFDTIERISQIVDGIELSPPKDDSVGRITFDKLPVEMVREILLRLNDYRDLVNSAQASPVMRTMVDSQHIWQRLCRYHFNDQQLKLALESHKLNLTKRVTLRGVKYARTASADGRTSYRNPVAHKQRHKQEAQKGFARRHTEQTIEKQRNRNLGNESNSSSSSTSYVTNAIRIFDNGGAPTTSTTTSEGINRDSRLEEVNRSGSKSNAERRVRENLCCRTNNPASGLEQLSDQTDANRPSSYEIDWERVFHQLRKRFDLKEEYPDCLLLCRHCRCLFWKSFGHPCIKSDDDLADEDCFGIDPALGNASSLASNKNPSEQIHPRSVDHPSRPSVAFLSRNFDNGTLRVSRPADVESLAPADSLQNAPQNRVHPDINNQARPRQPLDDLNAQIQRRLVDQNGNRRPGTNGSVQREELVPKHVTITPQAFLKFFSL